MILSGTDKDWARRAVLDCGAVAAGFAAAGPVADGVNEQYSQWLSEGNNAGMEWMARHAPLRATTENVLPGACTVISAAFSYNPAVRRAPSLPRISCYAWGSDYHEVLRRRLAAAAAQMQSRYGGEWRVCCDTAPLPERWWAMQAGIGRRGLNGQIIIDGYGSRVFLGEILTTVAFAPDEPSQRRCHGCGACVRRCPGRALDGRGLMDCRRCLSYLTIEHRGDYPPDTPVLDTDDGRRTLYGCDLCLDVCPYNRGVLPTELPEFAPGPHLDALTPENLETLGSRALQRLLRGTAIRRLRRK